jgi:hypothetical protein
MGYDRAVLKRSDNAGKEKPAGFGRRVSLPFVAGAIQIRDAAEMTLAG